VVAGGGRGCPPPAALKAAGNPYHVAAWRLTGIAFLWHGSAIALQNVWGGAAIVAGQGSGTYAAYISWIPEMNHSRTFLMAGLMVGLIALALLRTAPNRRFWAFAYALLAVGFAVGVGVGVHEGEYSNATHNAAVAILDVPELITIFAALFALLLTNRADRILWGFVSIYGVGVALGVFWFVLLAQLGVPDTWQPRFWSLSVMRLVTVVLMLALAARRLSNARRGKRVPGMLETAADPVPMLR
jgi:hypothetical protein